MKKIRINNFKEHIYYEKLNNGLEVYLLPTKSKKAFLGALTVKYGGRDIYFKADDKEFKTPTGIAHFLEHKMFERDENPFEFYSKYGNDVNAFTNLEATTYHFSGSKCFNKSLKYLLNWIQSLNINEDLVKKEKGIILEEASMYKDNNARVMYNKLRENTYINHPEKYLVVGTDEDIKRITKEDLETCYKSFYVPNNMYLIISGNININKAIEIIKEETKHFKKNEDLPTKIYPEEPDNVAKEYEEIEKKAELPQIGVAFKMNKNRFKDLKLSKFELLLYLNCIINISLGNSSEIREKWINEGLFLNSFYELNGIDSHFVINFIATSAKPDELYQSLMNYIKGIKTDEDSFKREIKSWISTEVLKMDNPLNKAFEISDELLTFNKITPNKIEIYKNMNYKTLLKVKKCLDFDNKAVIKLMPKN